MPTPECILLHLLQASGSTHSATHKLELTGYFAAGLLSAVMGKGPEQGLKLPDARVEQVVQLLRQHHFLAGYLRCGDLTWRTFLEHYLSGNVDLLRGTCSSGGKPLLTGGVHLHAGSKLASERAAFMACRECILSPTGSEAVHTCTILSVAMLAAPGLRSVQEEAGEHHTGLCAGRQDRLRQVLLVLQVSGSGAHSRDGDAGGDPEAEAAARGAVFPCCL
ncbi:hypothetical protein MMC07_000393 [Pseudocyphellaria aurata]|nr:hypothetical protein [Pseudocyphellaria aurata]